jgi:hypothetical protein
MPIPSALRPCASNDRANTRLLLTSRPAPLDFSQFAFGRNLLAALEIRGART